MEKILVYIAGNPDAYPVEYYDALSGTYQGLIPELLRNFSQETGYDIQYYEAGKEDRREQLASSRQVDLISGLNGSEQIAHKSGSTITLLETGGVTASSYNLCLLDTAPEALGEELREYFSGVSHAEKTGMLIEASRQDTPRQSAAEAGVFGLALAVLLMAAAIALLVRRNRRQRRQIAKNEETDDVTGVGNEAYLNRYWQTCVDDRNRILCSMVTFYIHAGKGQNGSARPDAPEFMRHMADVLRAAAGSGDALARIPGRGFVLLRVSGSGQAAGEWLAPILKEIRDASGSGREGWDYGVSVGVYPLKADDRDLEEVLFRSLRCARTACREGLDFRICTEESVRELLDERRFQADMVNGLNNREFQIYIQFYVDAKTGRIIGGEALPYWEHPDKGLLPGESFLPQLEKAGLRRQLDDIMLDRAYAFLDGLRRREIKHFFLTYRFSRETLSDAGFAKQCEAAVEGRRLSKDSLYLGMTVSGADSLMPTVSQNLWLLRETGFLMILEDFDCRLTSLFDGNREPFNGVKLSREMIENIGTASGPVIPRSLIRMGHDLGVPVLAEGVDTEEQAQILRDLDCDMVRGGAYFQPLPVWAARKNLGGAAVS